MLRGRFASNSDGSFDGFEFTQMILWLREVTDDILVQENRGRPDVFDQIRDPLVAPE